MDYSSIRGFNYQPSWGSSGLEIWRQFDHERMGHELAPSQGFALEPRGDAMLGIDARRPHKELVHKDVFQVRGDESPTQLEVVFV